MYDTSPDFAYREDLSEYYVSDENSYNPSNPYGFNEHFHPTEASKEIYIVTLDQQLSTVGPEIINHMKVEMSNNETTKIKLTNTTRQNIKVVKTQNMIPSSNVLNVLREYVPDIKIIICVRDTFFRRSNFAGLANLLASCKHFLETLPCFITP
ncbi:uncharacterized protein EV154DRAFT_548300 [Mucor mucedo]|uniref:uncharacterized protein n=1 Tax=Mucor mucedo TaxID=29922 RepID=UPI00221F61E6|nr:uncharacterized protein EV154DRAFT_548300 [Mucor mucedo]KAI7895314.1 hypothetical protein EV154DRAFT_548300 [Mucor mucedo]